MKQPPKWNQLLYSLNVGNAARNRDQVLTPVFVVKVGRKYFTTRKIDDSYGFSDTQYHISDWREKTDYSPNSKLYETLKEFEDEKLARTLLIELADFFDPLKKADNLSVDQLQRIKAIVFENRDEGESQ